MRRLSRRPHLLGVVMAAALAGGLLSAPPVQATSTTVGRPKVSDHEKVVAGKRLSVKPRRQEPIRKGPPARKTWPQAGTAQVALPTSDAGKEPVRAGSLPVWIGGPEGKKRSAVKAPASVKVQVLEHRQAEQMGVGTVAFTVARDDDAAALAPVTVRLDYSSFAQAFGGSYGSRLRLVQLPACALTTPAKSDCRTSKPLTTTNDTENGTLTAQIDAAPETAAPVLAVAADGSGVQGDYKATSLSASATWKAGGNSGDFSWSYPMRVPPVPGGLVPPVELSYSSGSVDGRTGNTNGQPSWVGQGFDLWPGFIERSYKSCEDDGAPKDEWGNAPGDQCWGYDNATLTWNGKGGELIPAGNDTWRLKNDDGTRIEKLTSSNVDNGDNNNEYWKVTTTDGTRYYFGNNTGHGSPATNSTWTVPVFGDDSDEPCHDSTFASSWCQQAWRWNLDYVVDRNGNAIVYTYAKETNHYGRNLKPADETPYVRGGYLQQISYGLREGSLSASPPAKVLFDVSERCLPDAAFDCAPSKIGDNPDRWWDVPWDLNCNSGQECKDEHGSVAPTFWSRKRLTKVTTQVVKADGTYRPVDSWSMDHSWGLADVDRDLRLEEVGRTGHAGTTAVSLPKVTFDYVQLPNRMDETGDDILPYIRYRLSAIYDESGGQIDVSYSDPDCTLDDLPAPETNTTRCMPVRWEPPGREDPITDWFIKYVVTSVIQTDRTGLGEDMTTRYSYLGGAAWHYDDDDGLTKDKYKTWSQWRGYGHVRVRTGDYDNPSTQTDTYYLRGMDGDRLNAGGGTKNVTVPDGEGGNHTDHQALAGFELRTESYDEPGGTIVSKTVNSPWHHQTASRTRSWGTVTANLTGVSAVRSWEAMPGGTWRQTRVNRSFDTETGRENWVDDLGDVSTAADDKCTRTTYADDDTQWYKAFPSRVDTVSVTCADTTPDRQNRTISDVKTIYGARWNATRIDRLVAHDGTTADYKKVAGTVYDAYGRPTEVSDVQGNTTTTAYVETPATGGVTTKVTVTTPPIDPATPASAHTTVEDLDPAWGQPLYRTDVAGKRTELKYDALGRITQVWLPNRVSTSNPHPNLEFEYRVTDGQIVAVTTKKLTRTGGQQASIDLFDGWLRPRQTQAPGPDGRLITDTFYDNRGQVVKNYAPYSAAGAPEPVLFGVSTPGNVETQTRYTYDGLGRVTLERLMKGNNSTQELWHTTTTYDGNRTHVQPPTGGTPTTTVTDARGNTTQVIYHGPGTTQTTVGFEYDHAGRPSKQTGPDGKEWTTTYDLLGRKIRTTDPSRGTTTYGYDDLDRLVSTDDARDANDKLFYKYDVLGRKTETRSGSATGTVLATWLYDTVRKGALTSATRKGTGPNGNTYDYTTRVNNYDALGRPQSTTYTIPSVEGVGTSYTFGTSYNLDGTIQSLGMPAAGGLTGESVGITYDDYQRPTRLTSNLATYVNATTYTPTGKPLQYELGNTTGKRVWYTATWQYGTQRLATSRVNRENITGSDRYAVYDYDDAGNVTSITDTALAGTETQCFGYDYLRRLTDAWTQTSDTCADDPATATIGGPAPYRFVYTHNTAGNRTQEKQYGAGANGGTLQATRTYTYAGSSGLDPSVTGHMLGTVTQTGTSPYTGPATTETYKYDAIGNTTERKVGNRTQAFTYDTENELTKVTDAGAPNSANNGETTFVYTADGDRLIRRDPTGTTLYLPGTEVKLPKGGTTATGTRYYSHGGQTIAMRTPAGVTYLTPDHQGTSQVTVDAADLTKVSRRHYTPYGQTRGTTGTWPTLLDKGFVGGTNDTTGLTHLGAREYDPNTGRFLSVDPLLNLEHPQSWNGYTYANSTPVTQSDPEGLDGPLRGDTDCYYNNECQKDKTKPKPKPTYPEFFPSLPSGKGRYTQYRKFMKDLRDAPYDNPESLRIRIQAEIAFCSEYPTDDMCGGGKVDPHEALQAIGASGMEAADVIDAALYFAEGNWKAGLVSMTAAIPYLGSLAAAKRLGRAGRAADCNSFVPGTQVLMADGTTKPIEELQVGDEVIATDPETGKTHTKKVLATIAGEGPKNLVEITVDTDGPHGDQTGLIITTDEHPFWVAGLIGRWTDAEDLRPGMWLRTNTGTTVQVKATHTRTTPHQRIHNLTIADTHTYYVEAGDTPVLVHNTQCKLPLITAAKASEDEIYAANELASEGYDVILRDPPRDGGTRGVNTSDLLVDGAQWDVYTPEGSNMKTILRYIQKKRSQVRGGGVVLNLSKSSLSAASIDVSGMLAQVNGRMSSSPPLAGIKIVGG